MVRIDLLQVVVASVLASVSVVAAESNSVDLSGEWSFRLDREDVGIDERWFATRLSGRVELPGSLQEHGLGDAVAVDTDWTASIQERSWFTSARMAKYREAGKVKIPFWLQPRSHYKGPAWYQREIELPAEWTGGARRIELVLERCHWETRVWVDDERVGVRDSLSTPHRYDLTSALGGPSRRHVLTIRVDNRLQVDVGRNAHSVSDHTQSNWNGVVGEIALRSTSRVWIADVRVVPDVAARTARLAVRVANSTEGVVDVTLSADAIAYNTSTLQDPEAIRATTRCAPKATNTVLLEYPLGVDAQLWDEFDPALYRLTTTLEARGGDTSFEDRATVSFGLREISTRGTQLVLNGRPIQLRGTLECCIFPLTGYPPTDVASWKRVIRICQAHGLNHIRFHSHCPPRAAFVAADELGFYYQVEGPFWTTVGDGKPVDRYIYEECDRILEQYGNHPSFLLMAYGNEPGGRQQRRFLGDLVSHWRKSDSRRLYTAAAGWPEIPQNQYHSTPGPRIQQWGAGLGSRINARRSETATDYSSFIAKRDVPVVSHEIGQWCVFPDFDEISKYTGLLGARNFEIFRDSLAAAHMADQARDFLMASGKLQVLCYKEEIESAIRTPGFGGFQLLDLHDFPGQGTALVGVLDPFWNSKPYITPREFRRFCGRTVPLARLPKRVFTSDETLQATVDIAHYGPPLRDVRVNAVLRAGAKTIEVGSWTVRELATGSVHRTGELRVPLARFETAQKLQLIVRVEGTELENDWDIWVYPSRVDIVAPPDVLVADVLGDESLAVLKKGGRVLLRAPSTVVRTDVKIGFSSIFWNTSWTRGQPPHTLGVLCDSEHPALAHFPTESHTNWQWWSLISRSATIELDALAPKLRPIVQVVPDWFAPKRLSLLFEVKVGRGKLLVSSMDLRTDLDSRPAARQMLYSLLRYAGSSEFAPAHSATVDELRSLFREPTQLQRLGATARSTSQQLGYEAERAIDGDPKTMWHSVWEPVAPRPPHELVIDLQVAREVRGLTYLPRADQANGRIARYAIHVSADGRGWGQPAAAGVWSNDARVKRVDFARPHRARFVKLIGLSEVNDGPWISAAEVDVVFAP